MVSTSRESLHGSNPATRSLSRERPLTARPGRSRRDPRKSAIHTRSSRSTYTGGSSVLGQSEKNGRRTPPLVYLQWRKCRATTHLDRARTTLAAIARHDGAGGSGDTARRRQHWSPNFLRFRFWQGFRGRYHSPRGFAASGNRLVRCRL